MRLIATDLDGTLVNSADTVTPHSARVLERAKSAGYLVSFFTGRPLRGLDRVYPIIEPNAPVVGANGSQVASADRQTIHRVLGIGITALRELVAFCLDEGIDFLVRGNEGAVINANTDHPLLERKRREEPERALADPFVGVPHVYCADDVILASMNAVKFMLMFEKGDAEARRRVIEYCEKDPRICFTSAGESLFEVVPAEAGKGSALEYVCELLGISPGECLYFGEYDNDVSAFERAGVAVCMANGSEAAKAAADFICKSNDEDGVADFIETYLLGG